MSRLIYVHDLRRQAGQANSATPLTENLQKVEDLGQGFSADNWEPWSLSSDHVYDDGSSELRDMLQASAAMMNVVTNATWTAISGITLSAVNLINGQSGIFAFAKANTGTSAGADLHEIRLTKDGAQVRKIRVGEGRDASEGMTWACQATSSNHVFGLEVYIDMATPTYPHTVKDSLVSLFVVNK